MIVEFPDFRTFSFLKTFAVCRVLLYSYIFSSQQRRHRRCEDLSSKCRPSFRAFGRRDRDFHHESRVLPSILILVLLRVYRLRCLRRRSCNMIWMIVGKAIFLYWIFFRNVMMMTTTMPLLRHQRLTQHSKTNEGLWWWWSDSDKQGRRLNENGMSGRLTKELSLNKWMPRCSFYALVWKTETLDVMMPLFLINNNELVCSMI